MVKKSSSINSAGRLRRSRGQVSTRVIMMARRAHCCCCGSIFYLALVKLKLLSLYVCRYCCCWQNSLILFSDLAPLDPWSSSSSTATSWKCKAASEGRLKARLSCGTRLQWPEWQKCLRFELEINRECIQEEEGNYLIGASRWKAELNR